MTNEITVKFFASLREQLNSEGTSVEKIDTLNTVNDIRLAIIEQNPQWEAALTNGKLLTAVNHEMVQANHAIQAQDEVAFFPPVTGG